MKFKEISKEEKLYYDTRYNQNTIGNHIMKTNISTKREDKKSCGIITIFSLMAMSDTYAKAYDINENIPTKTVKNMIEISKEKIKDYLGEKHGL